LIIGNVIKLRDIMLALIVFVLIIGISSLTFIKLKRKYSQSRSGVFNTWIIPSIMAFLCFSVLMILAAIVIPKSELKQNTSERISVNQFNDNNEKILNQEFKSGIDSFLPHTSSTQIQIWKLISIISIIKFNIFSKCQE
jgi:uncharacterized membrane protein